MTKIYLFCKGATARAKVEGQITAKAVGLPVEILWDADWEPMRRIMKVRCGDVERSAELGSRRTGIIPWECLIAGQMLEIGLDGWDENGTLRIPTNWAKCEIVRQSVADADGEAAENPTPPGASGMPGEDGGYYIPSVDSAGNLSWTASREDMPAAAGANIKGPKGDTGEKGDTGQKGDTGAAGYTPVRGVDYWTEADKQEILDSLPSGGTGENGEDGGYYIPSVDTAGNLSWTASKGGMEPVQGANIKGPKGDTGEKGDTGQKGDTGAAGYTPVKGTDYWTAAERQAMIDDVLNQVPASGEGGVAVFARPESYGAAGDGVADDTAAIRSALESGYPVWLTRGKTYIITDLLTISGSLIIGNRATIRADGNTTGGEWVIKLGGSNVWSNVHFVQNYNGGGVYLGYAEDCVFRDCSFVVSDGMTTNGYVDCYTNCNGILFENCAFRMNSPGQVGGVWVREAASGSVTDNVSFVNCVFESASDDEIIGVWHWNGTVKNIRLAGCTLSSLDGATAPHAITFSAFDSIMDGCIINPTGNTASVFKTSDQNKALQNSVRITGCTVNNQTACANGMFNGVFQVESCTINSAVGAALAKAASVFRGCDMLFDGSIQFQGCKLDGCNITVQNAVNVGQMTVGGIEMQRCTVTGFDANFFLQGLSDTCEAVIEDCTFRGTMTRFALSATAITVLRNRMNVSNIYCPNGTGMVIGNIIDDGAVAPSSGSMVVYGNLVLSNPPADVSYADGNEVSY